MANILIVDDDKILQDLISAILDKAGHQARCAGDADGALAVLASGGVELALVDVVLPGRGGLDLLMQVRAEHPGLPVVVMSGKVKADSDHFTQLARKFGARCILPKPFTPAELAAAVDRALADCSAC